MFSVVTIMMRVEPEKNRKLKKPKGIKIGEQGVWVRLSMEERETIKWKEGSALHHTQDRMLCILIFRVH